LTSAKVVYSTSGRKGLGKELFFENNKVLQDSTGREYTNTECILTTRKEVEKFSK